MIDFDEFNKEKGIDENHRIIARLPILHIGQQIMTP